MAFHVACPITCKRICVCPLGFPEALQTQKKRNDFLEEVLKLGKFLKDQCASRFERKDTVQVPIPPIDLSSTLIEVGDGTAQEGDENLSSQTKRAELQRRAAVASLAAEDYARRFESANKTNVEHEVARELVGEEPESAGAKVMCRICFYGETEDSSRAQRMLPCKICGKRYHRNCLRSWAGHRDLFNWNSWSCPSCRICEVCRRAGDPTKFMFCKRCDKPYHCYCLQPPHKNPSTGAFLCPRHTRCHSCGSTVPGNGLSTRWLLEYTCCDACGRLFVKGKYCPVCLKVYRDSESTPMVCCDACQRWVHCECDGISDEKYQQFQADGNLYYKCAACRGDCYQVRDLNDAVQEMWRRRDKAEQHEVANSRAAAGLPSQEPLYSFSPSLDDNDKIPLLVKSDRGHATKISVKGISEKVPKNTKDRKKSVKKYSKKEEHSAISGTGEEFKHNVSRLKETRSSQSSVADENVEGIDLSLSHSPDKKMQISRSSFSHFSSREAGVKNKLKVDKTSLTNGQEKKASISDAARGTKLVIHLGVRKRTAVSSPGSEASSHKQDHNLSTETGKDQDHCQRSSKHGVRESAMMKTGKLKLENHKRRGDVVETEQDPEAKNKTPQRARGSLSGAAPSNNGVVTSTYTALNSNYPDDSSSPKDAKPLLKLKFKNPYVENKTLMSPQGQEEKSLVKGQRSKRKRPSELLEKASIKDSADMGPQPQWDGSNPIEEVMDANWILKKLGKDAIGKRVEIHQPVDNSWHKGVIVNVHEGTSLVAISYDDGRTRTLEWGKQGIRLISQKQKRTKMFPM